ncbi:MAG: 8-oxo-dGTP diphosphatase MutT [Pseudomonadales bacterium]|nr:8-oxo-dGTP diphosphatase MutT [Pseudomonadales bacterium]
MKAIQVVAGIIWSQDKTEILISKRPDHLHKGGFWEFPGGKVEAAEQEVEALRRELQEELSVIFTESDFFQNIHFEYPEKTVDLNFYHVYGVGEKIVANEGQEWRWVKVAELTEYTFPEANEPVVKALLAGKRAA